MTAYYYSPIGEKRPIKVTAREPIASLRQRLFRELSGELQLIRHDDDVDERFNAALVLPPNQPLKLQQVKDVDVTSCIPGDPHYSRPETIDPESAPTDRVIRKRAPDTGAYVPPQRCPATWKDLEMYVGAGKVYDEEVQFLRSINTGAPPYTRPCTIEDYNIGEGTVIKPEYKLFGFEIKDKNPKQDMKKLGSLPTLDTIGDRIWGGLDPDFWAGTVEQAPRLLSEFFNPPGSGGDEKGVCGANCERDQMPHVGRLVPISDSEYKSKPAAAQPRVFGVESRPVTQQRPQPASQMNMV